MTEDLPSLVSPDGIAGLTVTDIVDATNAEAAALTEAGADVVVMLVHEGAPVTNCVDAPTAPGATLSNGVSPDVDAIVSGHTHLNYSCQYPVAEWGTRTRPVVSAGQYGAFLNRLTFSVDPDSGTILGVSNENLNINTGTYPAADPEVAKIVAEARKRPRDLARSSSARSVRPSSARPRSPAAPRTTEVASPRSATWSPRSSGGPPAPTSAVAPRSGS